MTARLSSPLSSFLGTLLVVAALLSGCDTAVTDTSRSADVRVGTNDVRATPAGPRSASRAVVARPGPGRPVAVESSRPGRLDVYFGVEDAPSAAIELDLYEGGEPDGRGAVARLRQDLDDGGGRLRFSTGRPSELTVEYVSRGRVVASEDHASTAAADLGDADEAVESVHYKEEDGKIIIVYDFTDGEAPSVTTSEGRVVERCSEVRVRPSGSVPRLRRPAVAIGGTGWERVEIEDHEGRFGVEEGGAQHEALSGSDGPHQASG